jgi:hypothetical protein
MTEQPSVAPTLPPYGEATLADLSTSILASLAAKGEPNPLGLPQADRVCLLIIDGLGWELLRDSQAAAPFLSELAMNARPLVAGFPATTVTSLSSLGTGRPPGQHGMLGLSVRSPRTGRLLNGLRWDPAVDPVAWQPGSTIFERAAAQGITAFRVAPGRFRDSGLSRAAMRGADYRAANSMGALVAEAATALRETHRCLASVYYGSLDATGHELGCTSAAWRYQLGHVDRLVEQLASAVPQGTVLHIIADHGMIDVAPQDRIDLDEIPELRQGVALIGGEPRARHVYTEPGAAGDVLATWREIIGARAWIASREEAISAGWFGPVAAAIVDRIGDVVAAPAGPWAMVTPKDEPGEVLLEGMHGSLTTADQLVPHLLLDGG